MGGWGNHSENNNDDFAYIPNRNVYVFHNSFTIPPIIPTDRSSFSNPGPLQWNQIKTDPTLEVRTHADNNLVIQGNIFWTGDTSKGLSLENSRITEAEVPGKNAINTLKPEFANEFSGDFRAKAGGNLTTHSVTEDSKFFLDRCSIATLCPSGNTLIWFVWTGSASFAAAPQWRELIFLKMPGGVSGLGLRSRLASFPSRVALTVVSNL